MAEPVQREDILQAAAQVFREKGYHAASMQDIASSVNLQKASLYHHIAGKQELLLLLLDRALDILIGDIQAVAEADVPATEKLRRAFRAYVGRLTDEADLASVLLLEHRGLRPDLRSRHIRRRDRFERLWREIVREGIAAGEFRPVDEAVVAFALLGVQNWVITWYSEDGRFAPEELADQFSDFFLHGLLVESDGS